MVVVQCWLGSVEVRSSAEGGGSGVVKSDGGEVKEINLNCGAASAESMETVSNGAASPDKAAKDVIEKKEDEIDEMAVDGKDDENENKEEGEEKEESKSEAMEVDDDKEIPNERLRMELLMHKRKTSAKKKRNPQPLLLLQ
ncbi:hypothetical protein Tco_0960939 [Tanacetum coccineum]